MRNLNVHKALVILACLLAAVGTVGVLRAVVVFVATLLQPTTVLSLGLAVCILAVARKESPRTTLAALVAKVRGLFAA